MRNAKFKKIEPNYRKRVLEITLSEGGKLSKYKLPFSSLNGPRISAQNRFRSILIEKELAEQGVSYVLQDGSKGDFPSDYVLYYCDPTYDWSPLNQLKRALKGKMKLSELSVRTVADALKTSPSQVMRLLKENQASKQFQQLSDLAELAGYQIEFTLKKKKVA